MRVGTTGALHQQIDACLRGLRDEMIGFTSELVAMPSENPPGMRIRSACGSSRPG